MQKQHTHSQKAKGPFKGLCCWILGPFLWWIFMLDTSEGGWESGSSCWTLGRGAGIVDSIPFHFPTEEGSYVKYHTISPTTWSGRDSLGVGIPHWGQPVRDHGHLKSLKKTQEKTVAMTFFMLFFMSMFHMSMFPESYGCGMKVIFRLDLTVLLVHQINSGANEVWESWSPWYDDELFMLTYILQGFASMLRSLPLKISAKHKELTDVLCCRSVVEKIDDYHDRSTSWINVLRGFFVKHGIQMRKM